MPTRLRRRNARRVEPTEFGLAFRLAAHAGDPSWLALGGRTIAPAEQLAIFQRDPRTVLEVWTSLVVAAQRRIASSTGAPRSDDQVERDRSWAAGARLPWVVREALGRRCPGSRRAVEALLERYGIPSPWTKR